MGLKCDVHEGPDVNYDRDGLDDRDVCDAHEDLNDCGVRYVHDDLEECDYCCVYNLFFYESKALLASKNDPKAFPYYVFIMFLPSPDLHL